jgi:hypothetical protein
MHSDIIHMITSNVYNHLSHWYSTVPQVLTLTMYKFYMCAHMQSQVDRVQTDRVPRMLHATGRAIRQNDRAKPLQSVESLTTAPAHAQGERSRKCAALMRADPNLSASTLPTTQATPCEATAGRSDRLIEPTHDAHQAAAACLQRPRPPGDL